MDSFQIFRLYQFKKNKKNQVIIYVFGITICLYLITSLMNITMSQRLSSEMQLNIIEIESLNHLAPINDEGILYIKKMPQILEISIVKGIDFFVSAGDEKLEILGTYNFTIDDNDDYEEKIILSEALYKALEDKQNINFVHKNTEIKFTDISDFSSGNGENSINTKLVNKLFQENLEALPTILVKANLNGEVDLSEIENQLLKKGMKLHNYDRNRVNLLVFNNLKVLKYLMNTIFLFLLAITAMVSYSLCKEDKKNIAILKIHGYKNADIIKFEIIKYTNFFIRANFITIVIYSISSWLMKKILNLDLYSYAYNLLENYVRILLLEFIFGTVLTLVFCQKYLRTNLLKLIKL